MLAVAVVDAAHQIRIGCSSLRTYKFRVKQVLFLRRIPFYFVDTNFSNGHFSISELVLVYLSIPVVWFVSTTVGCFLFVLANSTCVVRSKPPSKHLDAELTTLVGNVRSYITNSTGFDFECAREYNHRRTANAV